MSVTESVFKFFAQTSPGLERVLVEELRNLGLKVRMRDDISHVMFSASYEKLFRILHESRTIESLKIQIGPEIKARGEGELEKNLQKLPWCAFLPIDKLHEFNQPYIITKSYRSSLFHEGLIKNIVEKQLNLLMIRKEYKALSSATGGLTLKSQSLSREIRQRQQLIESHKQLIRQNREIQKHDEKSSELANRPQLPDVHLYLVKDRASVLLKLHLHSLHRHDLKPRVAWAPIKEGIVAGSLLALDFKKKFATELKVWDPFCGSGSIVLELLSMMFQTTIRKKFDFFFLKNFPETLYDQYLLEQQNRPAQLDSTLQNISIIASDISAQAISYSLENFHQSSLETQINTFLESKKDVESTNKPQDITQDKDLDHTSGDMKKSDLLDSGRVKQDSSDRLNELAPFYVREQFCGDRVRFIRSDFEAISRLIDLKDYTIITNLPYGVRSSEHIGQGELISSFKRFSKVIRKNLNRLQDVYIYTTVHEKYEHDHFIHLSRMAWTIKQKYSLGGIEIGLFHLNKEISQTSTKHQVFDEQNHEKELEKAAFIENKLRKSPSNDIIAQQLRQIIGERSELAHLTPQEVNEHNRQLEMNENLQSLRKAAVVEPAIKEALDKKVHTPRQIKSIVIRKKLEYAKALRLRSLMQKDSFVQSLNQKEVERRIESKRNRLNTEFIKSVMDSVGIDDKEQALSQIQDKLDQKAELKQQKQEDSLKSKQNKNKVSKWY